MKEKLSEILRSSNAAQLIVDELHYVLMAIPEIKSMIGFEHRHPHHHLDVWNHTLQVIENLNTTDMELNMAALLHDIGKPFSFQEGEVRHFHGHSEVSCQMASCILSRLGYEKRFVDRVTYLVLTHDNVIDTEKLDNDKEMILKRLKLQYADAKAHHPDKVAKRLKILDDIKAKLMI